MQQPLLHLRPMRIIIGVSTAFHLRHLALDLINRGWDVEFHSYLPRWKTRQYGLPDHATVSHFWPLFPWAALALVRGAPVQRIRERLFGMVDRRIAKTMRKADVFVGLSAVTIESARAAREAGSLVLIDRGLSHILHQQEIALASGQQPPSELYVQRELASYAMADRIVVLSQFAKRTFVAHGEDPGRLELTTLGVDLDRFQPSAKRPSGPVRALYTGAWSLRKGCDLFAQLLEAEPDLELVHVGTVGDLPLLDHPRFRSVGYQTHESLAEMMRDFQLFVFPTRDDGFGMVMAEALASGMHVVASDASGAPDLAELVGEEFVTVFPAGSVTEFKAAVNRKLAVLARQNGTAAAPPQPERLAQLSWQAYGERYDAMLRRLLGAAA